MSSSWGQITLDFLGWLERNQPVVESDPDGGKVWPQAVGTFLAMLIIVSVIVTKQNLWETMLNYRSALGIVLWVSVIAALAVPPFLMGFLLFKLPIYGIWRFLIGFFFPFLPALLVRVIFY